MEIKRAVELALVALLSEVLPDFSFYPSKGGDDDGGRSRPKPPFGVVFIEKNEKLIAYQSTWMLTGAVTWHTRTGIQDVAEHADTVQEIYAALVGIGKGYDVDRHIMVHGIDIVSTDEFDDAGRQSHGDRITFLMGVSQFDESDQLVS